MEMVRPHLDLHGAPPASLDDETRRVFEPVELLGTLADARPGAAR